MKKKMELTDLLTGQDLNSEKTAAALMSGKFNPYGDFCTALIHQVWANNENGKSLDGMEADFDYYIGQLRKAVNRVHSFQKEMA